MLPCRVKDAEHYLAMSEDYYIMSLQRMAQGSRAHGSSVGFGTMCAYGSAQLSKADAQHNKDVHALMVAASKIGDWDSYLTLQSKLK